MPYDYTDIPPPPKKPDLIPAGTVATVSMHIRPGQVGEDGMLTRSKTDGSCEYLDCEFTVVDGEYARRKFWQNLMLAGTTDGQAGMVHRHRTLLKAIIDAVFGLDPGDESQETRARRTLSLAQLQNMNFMATIGEEKGKPKNDGTGAKWDDKNVLAGVITKDKKDWHPVEQPPPFNGGSGGTSSSTPPQSAPPVQRPGWAS